MNENKDEWFKELNIPEGTEFIEYNNFPVFELRLNKDKKLNGDFYLYLKKNDGSYYGIIKVDGNKNIKETYRDATNEEIEKYNIDYECLRNGSIFVSEDCNHKVTHIYYYVERGKLLRKKIDNSHIIQYDFFVGEEALSNMSNKDCIYIANKFNAKYIITFHELNSYEIDSYCVGLVGPSLYDIRFASNNYKYFRDNLLNLKDLNKYFLS